MAVSRDGHLDETIIELINKVEPAEVADAAGTEKPSRKEQSIYTGIRILGNTIEFSQREFVNGLLKMTVPSDYEEMDEEDAKVKYPMEQRPDTILTDDTGAHNVLFSYMEQTVKDSEMEEVRNRMVRMIRTMNPGIIPKSEGAEALSGKNVAYVEFTSPALDVKLYNLMFFFELEGRVMMVNINLPANKERYWKKPAFEMMRSIEVAEGGKENEQ
jgi:hypothetical protein